MTDWLHLHFSLSCIGEGNGNPLQRSCLENPRDGGAWWAAVYGVKQSQTRLKQLSSSSSSSSMPMLGFPGSSDGKEPACNAGDVGSMPRLKDPLEEGMATYSRILAGRIPWTEESGGLQSMGSQRVGHDWVTEHTHTHTHMPVLEAQSVLSKGTYPSFLQSISLLVLCL